MSDKPNGTEAVDIFREPKSRPAQEKDLAVVTENRDKDEKEVAAAKQLDYAGTLNGPAGDLVDIDGDYESVIYWAPEDRYNWSMWSAAGSVGPSVYEDRERGRIYLNRDNWWENDYVLYHERGHNLGFYHEDGGIMDYTKPDAEIRGLADTSKQIQQHSDGLKLFDWGNGTSEVKRAIRAWRNGHITTKDVRYCIQQWARGREHQDIYSPGYIKENIENADKWDQNIYTGGLYNERNQSWDGTTAWR